MRLKGFYLGRGQGAAAVLLLCLLAECLWTVAHTPMQQGDYRYARCGREMWEKPSPLQGYFTTCGNLQGDGTLAYRLAGLPLTAERWILLGADHFRKPENKLYAGSSLNGSTWEARHELAGSGVPVRWLLRLPFVLFALWLGGGLWWVARRLFGNAGGALALAFYVFCPAVVQYACMPNNEILALWGLYGLTYTAIGVAHAMQGPRRKWKPRILLLTFALGMVAAAHLLAALIGFFAGAVFLFYLAERRRSYASQILIFSALGALLIVFASFAFRVPAFLYVFTGGAARFWFTTENLGAYLLATVTFVSRSGRVVLPVNAPAIAATLIALGIYMASRRSRYFGNTSPLLMVLALVFLYTTQTFTAPWLWALPFLFTFIGGVFADALEGKRRRVLLMASSALVLAQAALCLGSLPT